MGQRIEFNFREEPPSESEKPKGFYELSEKEYREKYLTSEKEYREKYLTDDKDFKEKYGLGTMIEKRKDRQQKKKKSFLDSYYPTYYK